MSGRDKRSKTNGQKFRNKKKQDFSWQTPTTATPVPREIPNGHKKIEGKQFQSQPLDLKLGTRGS